MERQIKEVSVKKMQLYVDSIPIAFPHNLPTNSC